MDRDLFEEEHRWFRETVADFVSREVLPHREEHRARRAIPAEVWRAAGRHGFLGLGVAAEYGGSGVDDFRFNVVLNEELARAGMAYGASFGTHVDVVAPYLTRLTTPEQRERWLPGFCAGELVTAICMTEPGAGSDLAAMRTTARRTNTGWVLNGSKTFITNGIRARLLVVAARTGERAISLFVVEDGTEGFSRGRKLDKTGQPEADTAELFFEDVELPAENLLGEEGRGFAYMMSHLPQERMSSSTLNLAHARVAYEATLEYVRERHAFGRPVGSFQHNRFVLAELATELDVAQAFVDRCLARHARGELDAVDAAKAKWWSSHTQNRVIDACVQLHGGYGYMTEYEVARAWTDARVTRIWAGSNEIMKEIIGRSLGLGDPAEVTRR
jgi:alkylation response protein AidB-like acyl-CoA dehydrogenase